MIQILEEKKDVEEDKRHYFKNPYFLVLFGLIVVGFIIIKFKRKPLTKKKNKIGPFKI